MGSPERTRSSANRDMEEDVEVNIDDAMDDGWDDVSGRKRSTSDRHESRKKADENTLDRLSTWYQDGEAENKHESGDKKYSRAEESERKKLSTKYSEHEVNAEKFQDTDSKFSDRRDSGREKSHGYGERVRRSQRRWDEPDTAGKAVEYVEKSDVISGKSSSDRELESEGARERSDTLVIKSTDTKEIVVDHERSLNEDGDFSSWTKEKSNNRSRTPENNERRQFGSDNFETDYERSASFKRKEQAKDDNWGDRNRERENFKDTWKRRRDKETTREGDLTYNNNSRDWELSRRGGIRTEAVKTSSKYGISNENYDVIEIQTKTLDFEKEDSRSIVAPNSDTKPTPDTKEFEYSTEERSKRSHMSGQEDFKDRYQDGGLATQDQNSRPNHGQSSGSGSLPLHGNHEPVALNRTGSQSVSGNRVGRIIGRGGGRPTVRDNLQSGVPILGSPFVPLGMPPMQSLTTNMSPAPGPAISPGVFIPPFQPPIVWPGSHGVDMNMLLAVPPGLPPFPPTPRFPSNIGNPQNGAFIFNPSGPGRGMPGPNFNPMIPLVRGPNKSNAPPGKAPSRGEQNDYSQNFVDTGMRPQNYIRELELTSVVEDYPKLRDLIQRKDEIVAKSASHPMYYKCDLREQVLSPEFFGTKFDVVLIDPPWEEYVHRAPGVTDHLEYWTFEEIMNLKIEAITDTPSFIFLWVGDGVGLEQGRQCLKKWGFRRCEDICWVKTNKTTATPGLRHDSHTLFQRSKEHCLMGIKGTVRRSTDGHIIHANIDTDVIIAEEPPYGSTAKPEDMYRIVEHFALGRRRLELFGEDHNIRSGWLTVGKELSSSNFNSEAYIRNFSDKDGKVWVGSGGRNPPSEAPHLILTTPEIESLRPKSPMKNQQQQSASIPLLTSSNSINKKPTESSPLNYNGANLNQESYSSNIQSPAPWVSGDQIFDMYGYAAPFASGSGDFLDYESQRGSNMM